MAQLCINDEVCVCMSSVRAVAWLNCAFSSL